MPAFLVAFGPYATLLVPLVGMFMWMGRLSQKVEDVAVIKAELRADISAIDNKLDDVLFLLAGKNYAASIEAAKKHDK